MFCYFNELDAGHIQPPAPKWHPLSLLVYVQAATEQADKASTRLLVQRQTRAATQRQHEQQQRQQHKEESYKPTSGGSVSTMQARLQALALGTDCADCSP
jgi:hypothetical protein